MNSQHTPDAFEQGRQAYREYKSRDDNPFTPDSDDHAAWLAGYNTEKHS